MKKMYFCKLNIKKNSLIFILYYYHIMILYFYNTDTVIFVECQNKSI